MFREHYPPLVVAYLVGLAGWLVLDRLAPRLWPRASIETFARPWREFAVAIAAALGVVAMGQLWSNGIHLPEKGPFGPLLGAVDQALIFAPILLVPVIRRQPWTTAWLPRGRVVARLIAGVMLGSLAVTAYSLLRAGAAAPWVVVGRIWRYEHVDEMAQVFFEDVTIAVLFVRLAQAAGGRWAIAIVACLFAAGHVPAMLSQGASMADLGGLLSDAALGVAVIGVLQRSRDIAWFWCLHLCLDMTQFAAVTGIGSAP